MVDAPEFIEFEDEGGSPGIAGDMAFSAARGLGKGVTGLAGLPGDMLSAANKAGDWVNQKLGVPGPKGGIPGGSSNPFVPTSEQLRSTIEEVTGNWGEAKTTPGKYMESVTSMIPSAMLSGGGLLAKGATAVGGGVGAEAGGELSALAGFGETPGKIVGSIVGGGIGGATTAARTPRPDFEETFASFQRLGLTPTAATTGAGGKTAKWLEANALPQAIGSANKMQKTMEGNLTQFTKKQQEIAANFGAPAVKKAEMGEDLQKTVLEGWQGRKEEAGKIFNAIGQAFGPNDKFAPSNLLNTLNKPIGSASTREVQAMTNAPELQELDHLLTQTGGQLSYSDMIALKSKFGDMLDPRYAKPVNKAQIGQIVEALDRDIEGTIKTLGNKDVVHDWQYAKATYANAMQDYQQAFKKLLGTREMPVNAERVYDIMVRQAGIKVGADMESFKRTWSQLGKAKQGDLSATVLSHMGNKDPSKLGDMEGFSLPTFLTNYKNLSTDAKDMMFRQTGNQALEKSLDDLVLAANKMGVWSALESSSRSQTVGAMMAQVAAPAVFAATGKFSEAAKALLLNIGGPAAASTVLTDPKWVRRLAYAMDKVHGAMTGSTKALLGVVSQAQQEGLSPPQENQGGGNQIPQFAEGGIVTQPTVAMIGEKGPEAVVPLDDPAAAQQAADVAAARTRAPYAKAAARPTGLLEGLDELGGYFSNKLMSAMTAPRDAMTGALPVTDPATGMPTPQAMQRGQGVANLAMTSGIPFAQRGAAGMAGGKLSQPDPLASLREAAREAAQPGVKANLPPPKNLLDRAWDNYTKKMPESEVLKSEAVWGTAKRIVEQEGISEAKAFAKVMNDWYKRKGIDKRMTETEANEYTGGERTQHLLRDLGILGGDKT